jgi:hypothetical protein
MFRRMAANASARAQRSAFLASALRDLTGFYLAVDCLTPRCRGERCFAVSDLANFYPDRTLADILRLLRCSGCNGGRVSAAALMTGPLLNARIRPRRIPLRGPDAHD